MPQINFLHLQQEKLKQKAQRTLMIQMIAFGSLIVYFLLVAATFAYYFFLGKEAKLLDQKIAAALKRVEAAVSTETKQFYLKNKANNLTSILEGARSHQTVVKTVLAFLPEGVEINDSISETGEISLSGKAVTFSALNNLFTNIRKGQNETELSFSRAQVSKVIFNEKGELSFDLIIFSKPVKTN